MIAPALAIMQGAAAAVLCQELSRAVKSDSKDKRAVPHNMKKSGTLRGDDFSFSGGDQFSSLAKSLLFGYLQITRTNCNNYIKKSEK